MRKVSFTRLLHDEAGLDLKTAKQVTDDLLEGKSIVIELADSEQANDIAERVRELGVDCDVSEDK